MSDDSGNCYGTRRELVACILTYNNHTLDIYLNYTALLFAVVPLCLIFTCADKTKYSIFVRFVSWISVLFGLILFQLLLCMLMHCAGISIVWSALCSFSPYVFFKMRTLDATAYQRIQDVHAISVTLYLSLFYCSCLWVYYAVTVAFITTLAHVCAFIMGIVLANAYIESMFKLSSSYSRLESTPAR